MSRKVIVSCAVTGSAETVDKNPAVPVTPRQIADDAVRAYEAGAAVAHIHVRNPETGQPSPDIELFREVITEVNRIVEGWVRERPDQWMWVHRRWPK